MFKQIILTFKELSSKPAEFVGWLVLLVLAFGGLLMAVFDGLGHPLGFSKHSAEVTLGLVGLLGLHFCLERFTVMQRVEKRLELLNIIGTKDVPHNMKSMVKSFVSSHVRLNELRSLTRHDNPQLSSMADKILNEHTHQLREFTKGRLNVPSAQKANLNRELMKLYVKRFDAVSEKDLEYWAEMTPDAAAYFNVGAEAVRRRRTIVTRIFIFTLDDLINQTDKVVRVLVRHQKAGIGWGVAVDEELDPDVKNAVVTPDYALYDVDRAVSPKDTDKRFETIFATDENDGRICDYTKNYKDLVSECWLVSSRFAETYSGALGTDKALAEVKQKCQENNKKLNEALCQVVTEDPVFVLVAPKPELVELKVKLLIKIVNEYREILGK